MDTYHVYDSEGTWEFSSWFADTDYTNINWLYEMLRRGTYDNKINYKLLAF